MIPSWMAQQAGCGATAFPEILEFPGAVICIPMFQAKDGAVIPMLPTLKLMR